MVRLYRDPKGENIFGKTNNATTGMVGTNLNDPEKVTTLEKKVRDLKSQLSRYEVRRKVGGTRNWEPEECPFKALSSAVFMDNQSSGCDCFWFVK